MGSDVKSSDGVAAGTIIIWRLKKLFALVIYWSYSSYMHIAFPWTLFHANSTYDTFKLFRTKLLAYHSNFATLKPTVFALLT